MESLELACIQVRCIRRSPGLLCDSPAKLVPGTPLLLDTGVQLLRLLAGICLHLFCHLMDFALQLAHLGIMTFCGAEPLQSPRFCIERDCA